jgi:restriction system protein
VLAAILGVALFVWKVISASPQWEISRAGAISQLARSGDSEAISLSVADRLEILDWFQLEKLVVALFEASGYRAELRGGANPDGGIDLVVENTDGRVAVQCKHWGKWKCGVSVVRELMGSMLHDGIPQGYLIATEITPNARELAAKHSIGVMGREELSRWIEGALANANQEVRQALERPQKLCPKCGSQMVQRTARKGKNAGGTFFGCSRYPRCNQIMSI